MKNFSLSVVLTVVLSALVSCSGTNVKISGNVACASQSGKIAVKTLGAGTLSSSAADAKGLFLRDSVILGEGGSFLYRTSVKEGSPEFFYLCDGDAVLAFLLLSAGDEVQVQCLSPGKWSVSGSEDCRKLRDNEIAYADFMSHTAITVGEYLAYYRKVTKFILTNSRSLTVVPELMRKVGDTPLFNRDTEFPIFATIADSLAAVYPESPYVAMLRSEVERRRENDRLRTMLNAAEQQLFPELSLPDINGKDLSLREEVNSADSLKEGAPVLLVFWNSADAQTKMYNKDVLEPLYSDLSTSAGLKIYQVDVSGDKTLWAGVVKSQKLPWTSVCDIAGRSVMLYGIQKLPSAFVLHKSSPLLQLESLDGVEIRKALKQ